MLSQSQIAEIHTLALARRRQRYLDLSIKVANLIVLKPDELQEMLLLRDSLQHEAESLLQFGEVTSCDGKTSRSDT